MPAGPSQTKAKKLTPQEKQAQVKLAFIAVSGCLAYIFASLSPFTAALLLGSAVTAIAVSIPFWSNLANLRSAEEPQPRQLENIEKLILAVAIPLTGTLLLQFYPFFQIVLCTLGGLGAAAFFLSACLEESQTALNQALRQAAQNSDLDLVNKALERGADPFAPELGQAAHAQDRSAPTASKNTAFHLAIKNHVNTKAILEAMRDNALKTPLEISDLFSEGSDLFKKPENQLKWTAWWTSLKECLRNYSPETRGLLYSTTLEVKDMLYTSTKNSLYMLCNYVRSGLHYPRAFAPNHANLKPLDILNRHTDMDAQTKQALTQILTQTVPPQNEEEEEDSNSASAQVDSHQLLTNLLQQQGQPIPPVSPSSEQQSLLPAFGSSSGSSASSGSSRLPSLYRPPVRYKTPSNASSSSSSSQVAPSAPQLPSQEALRPSQPRSPKK